MRLLISRTVAKQVVVAMPQRNATNTPVAPFTGMD